ncbi:unnamed protein product [Phyllotreta striolata]|uniref:Mitochondrial cardiolipin hydrolase n=1 Tax=Phyllotreta striolata TaxID=444603 RepID=A0A9P0GNP1_PHYSR|nr:unnamed protein product [Phyllotreta striolata]
MLKLISLPLPTVSLIFLAVTLIPCYIKYKKLKKKYNEQVLFKERHNCVVMYTAQLGMKGWPPSEARICPNIIEKDCLDRMYEPILYFINTSVITLDIAYMMISINKIYDALFEARKRGVEIRLIMNFDHCKSDLSSIRKCINQGIKVQLYISKKTNLESIMHYKSMLKDYEENKQGYVMAGSMNLTKTAFLDNYEDLVFMSDLNIARAIHTNFEKCWRYIKTENENLVNKSTLMELNILEDN